MTCFKFVLCLRLRLRQREIYPFPIPVDRVVCSSTNQSQAFDSLPEKVQHLYHFKRGAALLHQCVTRSMEVALSSSISKSHKQQQSFSGFHRSPFSMYRHIHISCCIQLLSKHSFYSVKRSEREVETHANCSDLISRKSVIDQQLF